MGSNNWERLVDFLLRRKERKLYKLTNDKNETHSGIKWGIGITPQAPSKGNKGDVTHAYRHPLLTILFNPIHADFAKMCLWEVKGVIIAHNGLAVECRSLTVTKRLKVPQVTTEHRVIFAILCALEVYKNQHFVLWAKAWLENKDRSIGATRAAREATRVAVKVAEAAVRTAYTTSAARIVWAAADAHECATRAALYAIEAAMAAREADATDAAVAHKRAIRAALGAVGASWAVKVAEAALWAIKAADAAREHQEALQRAALDFGTIAEKACAIEGSYEMP